MNNRIKATTLWMILVLGIALHTLFELTGIFFGKELAIADATGEIPMGTHWLLVIIHIIPLTLCLLTLYIDHKIFRWISFIFCVLLLLMNAYHLVEEIGEDAKNIYQLFLLTFILAANIMLAVSLNIWRQHSSRS